jgi:hypothetical protein
LYGALVPGYTHLKRARLPIAAQRTAILHPLQFQPAHATEIARLDNRTALPILGGADELEIYRLASIRAVSTRSGSNLRHVIEVGRLGVDQEVEEPSQARSEFLARVRRRLPASAS